MIADHLKELPLVAALLARYPDALERGHSRLGELTLQVSASQITAICAYVRHEQGYNRLSAVTAVDWAPQEPRFEVVYHLHSLPKNERLRLKCRVPESPAEIDSVTGVWRGADWYEREIWDMFGIRFRNHPDHRRILMPDDWEGHPLRKDYPVHGYKYSYQNE